MVSTPLCILTVEYYSQPIVHPSVHPSVYPSVCASPSRLFASVLPYLFESRFSCDFDLCSDCNKNHHHKFPLMNKQ